MLFPYVLPPQVKRLVLARLRVIHSSRRTNEHEHFGSPEKRSFKTSATVGHAQLGYDNPGRKEQRQSRQAWQETSDVCKRKSQNSEGAKGEVGEGESSEEERLTTDLQIESAATLKSPRGIFR